MEGDSLCAKLSLAGICVPKCNLGTRGESALSGIMDQEIHLEPLPIQPAQDPHQPIG